MTHDEPAQRLHLTDLIDRSSVVVGVDGSQSSQRALDWAIGMARRTRATLIVVHVRRTIVTFDGIGPHGFVEVGGLDDATRTEIASTTGACGVDVVHVDVRSGGGPATEIARIAQEVRSDLVVVGASRHPLHRVAGSVGARLAKHCGCPVTVVP